MVGQRDGQIAGAGTDVDRDDVPPLRTGDACEFDRSVPQQFGFAARNEGFRTGQQIDAEEMLAPGEVRQRHAGQPLRQQGVQPSHRIGVQRGQRDAVRRDGR